MSRTLLYAPNWLGDAIMAMPALAVWRKWNPGTSLTLLTKAPLAPLWRMHPAVDEVVELKPGLRGTLAMGRALRRCHFDEALLLPNSFRSAFIPWLARIPRRRGFSRHARGSLLTEHAVPRLSSERRHQCWECADILLGEGWWPGEGLAPPRLVLSEANLRTACRTFGIPPGGHLVGVIPGAARGESKRWPFFGETACKLGQEAEGLRFVVFGTGAEASLCREVATKIGPRATCVAGATSLPQFAALLAACRLVLCNDSGGMHLATSVGTPVVAVFGLTDPERTGPLGQGNVVIRREDVAGDRAIARNSRKAAETLRSISPERVLGAVRRILGRPRNSPGTEAYGA